MGSQKFGTKPEANGIDKKPIKQEISSNIQDANLNKLPAVDVDYDELLSSAGEFGLYQVLLFFSTFPFYVISVFVYFSQLFMTEVPQNHWCWIPELGNLTDIERRNLAIPADDSARFGYSQCYSYQANWTEVLLYGQRPDESWIKVPCQHGWEFNRTEIPYPTISTDLEWVCEKDSYQASAQSIFFVGSIFGGFLIGWISDRFGRIPAAVVSNVIAGVGSVASIFATNFLEFAICRLFTGIAYDNCMIMVYLIVLEYVAPKYRTIMANLTFALFYALAATSLPWIALLSGHWKTLSLVSGLPCVIAIFCPFFIPESPRWLLAKGRTEEAINKVLTIGRVNKKEVSSKLIEQFRISNNKTYKEDNGNIIELLKRPVLRRVFVLICIEYVCCTIVFDALVRCIGQLNFNFFVSFSVMSFTEFPSMLIAAFMMDWLGRRWLSTIMLTLSCFFSVLTVFIEGGLPSVLTAAMARFTVNIAYGAAMQWAAEMLPVSVRGSGVSIVHICAFIAIVLSPYIAYLETYLHWLPLVVVGGIAGVGAIIALFLPETAMRNLPQTFDEAEDLITSQKFWEIPCIKKKTYSDTQNNGSFEM